MHSKNNEPNRLRRGKIIHKIIQNKWINTAEGQVTYEESIIKPDGRKGRMDIFVISDETLVAIVEIKTSDWDAMTLSSVRKNIKRQANQIWKYIKSQLKSDKEVSPGIIFTEKPKDIDRLELIEQSFNEQGIQVVWKNEIIED